jgi:hypothetical protein
MKDLGCCKGEGKVEVIGGVSSEWLTRSEPRALHADGLSFGQACCSFRRFIVPSIGGTWELSMSNRKHYQSFKRVSVGGIESAAAPKITS